ncbi:unnamed protein product [Durusdinium trenchii]|uniref:Calmodulin-lysine N-methyltransferase n=1 Tax=Durusdinium trenchii TaxID=1381693 RepID=A0ABP0NNK5_9DINO
MTRWQQPQPSFWISWQSQTRLFLVVVGPFTIAASRWSIGNSTKILVICSSAMVLGQWLNLSQNCSSIRLCRSMIHKFFHQCGKHVLEIGAGVALVGLTCCACGAKVRLTDGENRLVKALEEHHGHRNELSFEVLDWNVDQGVEQFDVIVASDVLLCCCGAPEALPAVLSRRLKLDGKALLLNALRGARAQLIAISLLQRHGFLVSIFAVASLDMLPLSTEQISKLPDAAHVLLVVTWADRNKCLYQPLPLES